jgi:hypothetical protein
MTMSGDADPGVARREGRGFVDSFGAGRVCSADGCETVLSKYNDDTVCWAHERARRS